MPKKLSNPYSTGGGGHNFETQVQASFVALMLSGGYAPCFPDSSIEKIELQGRINGYNTDDLIVTVKKPGSDETRKILGQVKRFVRVTKGNAPFKDVLSAAWRDFNNPAIFNKEKDAIVLFTGLLNDKDYRVIKWLLEQARCTNDSNQFFQHCKKAKFSPDKTSDKLDVIKEILKTANNGNDVPPEELYKFLQRFHCLVYDLDIENGVVLSFLLSHFSQFNTESSLWTWGRILDVVQIRNQNAGVITRDNLPEDLIEAFKRKEVATIPAELSVPPEKKPTDWNQHSEASYLALATLIGGWDEKNKHDIQTISDFFKIDYETWLQKARIILISPDSPLKPKENNTWTVENRIELWHTFGAHVLDNDLDAFKKVAVRVLRQKDPMVEYSLDKPYTNAEIIELIPKYSEILWRKISEGLAIIASQSDVYVNCSFKKAKTVSADAVHEILADADWDIWASLNPVLPNLAEAAPNAFLTEVDKALHYSPSPFDQLYAHQRGAYTEGLIWALEGLAWHKDHFLRACMLLGKLANYELDSRGNRSPINSLAEIFLPWLPHTLAPFKKRKTALKTLLKEQPDIAFEVLVQLLPNQHPVSTATYKPKWFTTILEDWEKHITTREYWDQVFFYGKLLIKSFRKNAEKLVQLIDKSDFFPEPLLNKLIDVLAPENSTQFSDDEKRLLWEHLSELLSKHKNFVSSEWRFSNEKLAQFENLANAFTPQDPCAAYQYLFNNHVFNFYESGMNIGWDERDKRLADDRDKAIHEIFQQKGLDGVIQFSQSVNNVFQVGYALSSIQDKNIERVLVPELLNSVDVKQTSLAQGFIIRRHELQGWAWSDNIDRSAWSREQTGRFLTYLPFASKTWERAAQWLGAEQKEYWSYADEAPQSIDKDPTIAVKMFLKYDRPILAAKVIYYSKYPISADLYIQTLLVISDFEKIGRHTSDQYIICDLIKRLQLKASINPDDMEKIEWHYLSFLNGYSDFFPKSLERKLVSDPEFFCKLIRLMYRSDKEENTPKVTAEQREESIKAWKLLDHCKTIPGEQDNRTFNAERFNVWLAYVKEKCAETGHLDVAFSKIGHLLIHAPADLDGLWIDHTVAAALDASDAETMRNGFRTGLFNFHGIHWVDPTEKPGKGPAEYFRQKAEEIENAGFYRLPVILKSLADDYESLKI